MEKTNKSEELKSKDLYVMLKNTILRDLFIIIAVVCLSLGLFLLIAPEKLSIEKEISYNIGASLLTTAVVAMLLEFLTKKHFEQLISRKFEAAIDNSTFNIQLKKLFELQTVASAFQEYGLNKIHKDRTAIDMLGEILNADKGTEIKLLGICLRGFVGTDSQTLLLKKLIEDGCNIKMLLIKPESSFVEQRGIEEDRDKDEIKSDIVATNSLHRNLIRKLKNTPGQDKLRIKYYDAPPNLFMLVTNKVIIVGFYLRDRLGEFFPQIELEYTESGIAKPFLEHYDSLWKVAVEENHK